MGFGRILAVKSSVDIVHDSTMGDKKNMAGVRMVNGGASQPIIRYTLFSLYIILLPREFHGL